MASNKKYKKSSSNYEIERLNPQHATWYSKKLILEHLERYKFAAKYCNRQIVADLGCGTGYGSSLISTSGAKKVYALDLDPAAINHAKKNYSGDNISFIKSSADDTKLRDNYADIVLCFEVIEHLKRPDKLISEIYRIMKPGGKCFLSTPNKHTSFMDNPYHINELTIDELSLKLKRFRKIEFYGQRKVNLNIVRIYQFLHKTIKLTSFRFFLKLRPWENYKIKKLKTKTNPPYLYLISVVKK